MVTTSRGDVTQQPRPNTAPSVNTLPLTLLGNTNYHWTSDITALSLPSLNLKWLRLAG